MKWERLGEKVEGYHLRTRTKKGIVRLDTDPDVEHMLKGIHLVVPKERRESKTKWRFLAFVTGRSSIPSTKLGNKTEDTNQ